MEWMQPELREAWLIVVRDVLSQGALEPRVVENDWAGPEQPSAMTWWPDGSGSGISVPRDDPRAERIVFLADVFQDAEVEGLAAVGRSPVWPSCPEHPDTHPLRPEVRDGSAVWFCPADGTTIARIGHLPPLSALRPESTRT